MRIHIPHVLATVRVDDILFVDWQLLIWIDGNKYNTLEQINRQIRYKPSRANNSGFSGLALVVSIIFFFKYDAWRKKKEDEKGMGKDSEFLSRHLLQSAMLR